MVLKVSNLTTHFSLPYGIVQAVRGVSFELKKGESLALVGESGCGKTVTCLSLLRLLPSNGRVVKGTAYFQGQDLFALSPQEFLKIRGHKISMIYQDPMTALNPVLTIGFQVAEPLWRHKGLSKKEAYKVVEELLAQVGIPDPSSFKDKYPHQLSGGMRQRVIIAMALSCDPEILIADEPTTALDVTVQAQILDLIASLQKKRGTSLLLVTHDLGIVADMADRVAVFYGGRIVETAPVEEIFYNPLHPYTQGLLACLPRMEGEKKKGLPYISGYPPNLISPPPGCPFAPRCNKAQDICQEEIDLWEISPGHWVSCHRVS